MRLYLLIFLLLLLSCQKRDSKSSNTLQYLLSDEVSTLDPAKSYDVISATVIYQCLEPLYQYHYHKRPYTIIPLVADGMPRIENSGKRYIIKIKKNIQYHPHEVFKDKPRLLIAKDFITQIKRLAYLKTNSNGWWLFDGRIRGLDKFRKSVKTLDDFEKTDVAGLKAPDDHTLIIELNDPYPQMLSALAMTFTVPTPIELVKKYNNRLVNVLIGTGPFMLEKWSRLSSVKLIKNPNYDHDTYPFEGDRYANANGYLKDAGRKLPFLDAIEFKIMKENQTQWLNFLSNKIDILTIPKDNYDIAIAGGRLRSDIKKKNIKLQISPTLTYWWLSFNMEDPILGKNLMLRRAIAHAFDVNKFIRLFTNNIGQKANSIYPPGIPGYNPSKQLPYKYNLKLAHIFLEKAGYTNGKGLPTLNFDVRGISAVDRQQGEYVKAQMAKIGINIKVVTNTFPDFLKKSEQGKLQFWQDGWSMDYPDAENTLQLLSKKSHSPGPNVTNYYSKEFEKLYQKFKFLRDGKEKVELMEKMENIVLIDVPWVMQYYTRNYVLFYDYVRNYRHSDIINNHIKYIRLTK
jgi:oligopeptide transport system substrate-binding protein